MVKIMDEVELYKSNVQISPERPEMLFKMR